MENHTHKYALRHKVSISGAAISEICSEDALEKAKEIGRELARHNVITVTGATTGVPYWAGIGAKEEGGFVLGYSPAASESAHVKTYKLPLDYHDVIMFTGFGYVGRDLLIVKSSDAVIIICGRIGTMHEFTAAYEEKRVIGVLIGSGGVADEIEEMVKKSHRGPGKVIYNSDPKELVRQVLEMVDKDKRGELEDIGLAIA